MSTMASSQQSFSTNDLRSASVDYKRDNQQKAKWANGMAWGPGRAETSHGRPIRPEPRMHASADRQAGRHHAARMARKHDELHSDTYVSGDSSADEDVEEASAAPAPDADIAYSFDAARGPSGGSQILSLALAKAVERFEDQTTTKLVKEEYEILDHDSGSVPVTPMKHARKRSGVEDEDYEFV